MSLAAGCSGAGSGSGLPLPRRRSRPEPVPDPFEDVGCPAATPGRAGRAGLAPAPFRSGPGGVDGFGVFLLFPDAADAAGRADSAGLGASAGLPEADCPAVADGFAAVDGFAGAVGLAEVSLLTADGFAGAAGALGAVPVVAAPGTSVGYRLNRKYCWPRVHTFVVTQYSTSPKAQYSPDRAKNGTM